MARPDVVVLMSASLDGRTALGPGRSQWEEMDGPRGAMSAGAGEAWKIVEKKLIELHEPQVMMLGSASIQKEAEPLRALDPVVGETSHLRQSYLPDEVVHRLGVQMWLVTPDSGGRLRSGYKGRETPGHHTLHLVSETTPAEYLAFLRAQRIPYLVAGSSRIDLPLALERLSYELGVTSILVIGGGRLNGALLRAGLVDEVNVIVRPELIGGTATPTLFDCADLGPDEWPTRLERISAEPLLERFLWLRYRVARKGNQRGGPEHAKDLSANVMRVTNEVSDQDRGVDCRVKSCLQGERVSEWRQMLKFSDRQGRTGGCVSGI